MEGRKEEEEEEEEEEEDEKEEEEELEEELLSSSPHLHRTNRDQNSKTHLLLLLHSKEPHQLTAICYVHV